jgi:hypothetical protein
MAIVFQDAPNAFKIIHALKYLPLIGIVYGPVSMEEIDDIAGIWNSITLSGNLDQLSPDLHKFRWQFLEQTRTRDDNPQDKRLTESLLFGQLGYTINAINRRI